MASSNGTKTITLYGPQGQPIDMSADRMKRVNRGRSVEIRKTFASYVASLYNLDADPLLRATRPFETHPWIYAAAMARSTFIAQAPFIIFRETEEAKRGRVAQAKRAGRPYVPRTGQRRRAIYRHLTRAACPGRFRGQRFKLLEADLDHSLMDVFTRPNPMMTGTQLWQATELWMALRGEAMWLLLSADGSRLKVGAEPAEIWPVTPDLFKPAKKAGRLLGWEYEVRTMTTTKESVGQKILLGLHELIQFKYVNLSDPWRGFPPINPLSATIHGDLLARAHNRATIANGAEPGGYLFDEKAPEGETWDEDEYDDFLEKWEQRHGGPRNRRRISILPPGLKYVQAGMTPVDMDYINQGHEHRDEILAGLRSPKTVLGITDAVPYAVQQGQDKNFIDKTIIPEWLMFEQTLDGTLFFGETDNVVGAFDLANVEALRLGVDTKINSAARAASVELHMPPRLALETVGLGDVAAYEGDDVALVSPLLAPVADVVSGLLGSPFGPDADPDDGEEPTEDPENEPDEDDPEAPDDSTDESTIKKLTSVFSKKSRAEKLRIWAAMILRLQQPMERVYIPIWRRWIGNERRTQLRLFDEGTRESRGLSLSAILKQEGFDIDAILTPLEDLMTRLGSTTRPLYTEALESTYEFTTEIDLGGIPVFELDDPRIIEFLDEQQARLVGTVPKTIQRNLRRTLRMGIEAGEPIADLRRRIGQIFDISASSARSLAIARTESGAFINGSRDVMFGAQGFDEFDWITAGDEHVREHHVVYGDSGPHERGFNYRTLVGLTGTLRRPHDPEAPAEEVVNCRCMMIPLN